METTKTSYPKEKIKILLLENISERAVKRFTSNGYTFNIVSQAGTLRIQSIIQTPAGTEQLMTMSTLTTQEQPISMLLLLGLKAVLHSLYQNFGCS